MNWRGTCGALAVVLLFQAAAAADCPFERAHYVFKGHRRVTAEFVPHAKLQGVLGRVFVKVTVKPQGWTYWYFPETGNGYSMIRLISMMDPTAKDWHLPDPDSQEGRPNNDENYYGLNADLSFRDELPDIGVKAPDLVLIPDLPITIWYDVRVRLPRAFFVFDHCQR